MSSKRIVSSCAVLALVLLSGSWYAASAFPLNLAEAQARETPGPLEQRANPVSADNPVPKRTDYRAPDYPAEARSAGAEGTVTLRVTLDEAGRVAEVRRTGFSVTVDGVSMHLTNVTSESMEAFMSKAELRTKDGRPADKQAMMRAADAMSEAAATAVSQWRFEPPAQGPLTFDVRASFKTDGETVASVNRGIVGTPVASRMKYPSNVVRVGGDIKAPTKIKDVRPVYPVEAMRAKVTGMVIIEALIGPDGAVQQAQVLRSIPLLDQAALDAVRQWQFTPTLLNGVPTPVIMTVTVNFTVQ